MDSNNLSDDEDMFWALVKYAENVEESIKQIDSINASILPILEEIPIEPQAGNDISWKGFKAMRDVLTHQFKNIDPKILWAVVTEEFPVLNQLLKVLVVGQGTVEKDKTFNVRFRAGLFRNLPSFEPQALFSPGNSIVCLLFDFKGRAQCFRISRIDDGSFRLDSSEAYEGLSLKVRLVSDEEIEHLGQWENLRGPAVTRDSPPPSRH